MGNGAARALDAWAKSRARRAHAEGQEVAILPTLHIGDALMAVRRLADEAIQPKNFAFSAENLEWAKRQIARYPEGRQQSAILLLLWRAQEQAGGWLPQK